MCGIAGVVGIDQERARRMAASLGQALDHRGPDASGVVELSFARSPATILLHRRLSIIDLSNKSNQPMRDGPLTMVYNGEVYNYRHLLKDAPGDTAALLGFLKTNGLDSLSSVQGMYAFALVNQDNGRIYLVRDPVGIKPLYIHSLRGGGLVFASELKAILASIPELGKEVDHHALRSYFSQGAIFSEKSIIAGVELLTPGTILTVDFNGAILDQTSFSTIRSAFPVSPPKSMISYGASVQGLQHKLREVVDMHLIADAPLGVFLSSGIDSTAIAMLAAQSTPKLKTISVGFDIPEADETSGARRTAKLLGTEHHEVRLHGNSVLTQFHTALEAMDQPTVDGFNTYFVAKAARDLGLKVVLSGLGGDELFCGYASFRHAPLFARWAPRLQPLVRLLSLLGIPRRDRSREGAKLCLGLERHGDLVDAYFLRRMLCLPDTLASVGMPDSDNFSGLSATDEQRLRDQVLSSHPLDTIAMLELLTYTRHMLIRDADVFSMAHGLELRVPLLDYSLLQHVAHIPPQYKDPRRGAKRLLIDAVGPGFPEQVARQKKRGFALPWGAWLRGPLRDILLETALDRGLWQSLGLQPEGVRGIAERVLNHDPRTLALEGLSLIVLRHFAKRWCFN